MKDYLLLIHRGAAARAADWGPYFARLRESGLFDGGSAIGQGICMSKAATTPAITGHLAGYLRVRARDLAHAKELVAGNPVYEAGGVVEIRELPRD
jgi:hypothetical protein